METDVEIRSTHLYGHVKCRRENPSLIQYLYNLLELNGSRRRSISGQGCVTDILSRSRPSHLFPGQQDTRAVTKRACFRRITNYKVVLKPVIDGDAIRVNTFTVRKPYESISNVLKCRHLSSLSQAINIIIICNHLSNNPFDDKLIDSSRMSDLLGFEVLMQGLFYCCIGV